LSFGFSRCRYFAGESADLLFQIGNARVVSTRNHERFAVTTLHTLGVS
jgi:hypothetical protein